MHVGIANLQWRGKRSRHYRRMRNPQFYISDKRSIQAHPKIITCFSSGHLKIAHPHQDKHYFEVCAAKHSKWNFSVRRRKTLANNYQQFVIDNRWQWTDAYHSDKRRFDGTPFIRAKAERLTTSKTLTNNYLEMSLMIEESELMIIIWIPAVLMGFIYFVF